MILIRTIGCLMIWVLLGTLAFIIEAKTEQYTKYDDIVYTELRFCIIGGGIAMLTILFDTYIEPVLTKNEDVFKVFMDELLQCINKQNKGGR